MKYIELQRAFESGISSLDEISERKLSSEDIFYWLNIGVDKFIKDRIPESIQKNQVLTDDLSTLIVTDSFDITDYRFDTSIPNRVIISYKDGKENLDLTDSSILTTEDGLSYITTEDGSRIITEDSPYIIIPNSYWYAVGENVSIVSNVTGWPFVLVNGIPVPVPKIVDVIESTVENVTNRLNNSLSEHRLNRDNAKPIRVFSDNKINLYTDGNYTISNYELVYIRKPNKIAITSNNSFDSYTDMPDHTHEQIVKYAIDQYLASLQIKNATYPRATK